jgi:hypothetical protein
MTERVLILDFGAQCTLLIGANTTTCQRSEVAWLDFFVLQR